DTILLSKRDLWKEYPMSAKTVMCAKLKQELPALDESTPDGDRARRMLLLIVGKEMQLRVMQNVSAQAWGLWTDHMRMLMNEYRLDPTSEEANKVLRPHMESFFFGEQQAVPNFVAPKN
ncbi:MAG: Fe(2+)-trafficking protein, partial [Phycisphaerae bacterium]